ncbi:hypothetical protein VTK26DRAFT_3872 [Humicola hyalothermophila]
MNPSNSLTLSLCQYALGMIGTAGSWFLMARVGRRTIHFSGLCSQLTLLIIVGCLSFGTNNASVWAIGAMLIVFTFVYDFTTIVLARAAYNASNIFVNVMTNYQLNSTAWDWGVRTAFFWAGSCLLSAIWVFFRLPEPRGRTYAELDLLFERRVAARKFTKTKINPFEHSEEKQVAVEEVEHKEKI